MMESMSVGDPSPAEDHYCVQSLYALCGRNGFSNPEYEELSVEGASHDPLFTIRVTVRSLDVSAIASGRSKIAAKRTAATQLLALLRDHIPGSDFGNSRSVKNSVQSSSDSSKTAGGDGQQEMDLECKHRMKYRIPTSRHAAPSVLFELFRQIQSSSFPQFDECLLRKQANDDSFSHFDALIEICSFLGIKWVTHENRAIAASGGASHEAIIMLTYKEMPIMTTFASSEESRVHAIQEAAFRAVVSLCCSQKLPASPSTTPDPLSPSLSS